MRGLLSSREKGIYKLEDGSLVGCTCKDLEQCCHSNEVMWPKCALPLHFKYPHYSFKSLKWIGST